MKSGFKDINELRERGMTHEGIGLELGVSRATIVRKLSRYKKLKALEDSK